LLIISLLIVSLIITFLLVQPNIFLRDKETKGTLETGIDDVERMLRIFHDWGKCGNLRCKLRSPV
jgi:hypothetical protein